MNSIPIVSIVSTFGSGVLIVLIVMLFYYLNYRNKCKVMEAAIINGKEIPEDFFKRKEASPDSKFLTGLIWIAVGIGFSIFSLLDNDLELIGLASIPFLVGVAYVIVYFTGKKKKTSSDDTADDQQA